MSLVAAQGRASRDEVLREDSLPLPWYLPTRQHQGQATQGTQPLAMTETANKF